MVGIGQGHHIVTNGTAVSRSTCQSPTSTVICKII
jgi:hypothetical protein